jgi:hypothetical protein
MSQSCTTKYVSSFSTGYCTILYIYVLEFFASSTIYEIFVTSIPDSLLPAEEDKSCHASTMFNGNTEIISWFRENLVMPRDWEVEHPHDILPNSSNVFADYVNHLGFRAWNIENKQHATSYLKVTSTSNRSFVTIGGRADYLITNLDVTVAEYLNKILCVIEIQSKEDEELCQLQMQVYLLILMNTKHLSALVGFLIFKNGQCQAFKATRDETGGCIFEMNDRFHICYLSKIMVCILKEVGLI